MNVLLLAALTEATGNAVTVQRIARHFESEHRVFLVDTISASAESLKALVANERIDVALGVHALLAGPFLRLLGVPYALVFGGTDLYEPMHELHQKQMARAVAGAARLIAFSPENRARAEWMWPDIAGRVQVLPQAVDVPRAAGAFTVRAQLGLNARDRLVLLPTGIRRVKDPTHVVEAFSRWHQSTSPDVHLALAGAVLEPDYAAGALELLRRLPGVHFVDTLPRAAMLAAIKQADLVLNTSLSEGMCGVVLEAMALGTPVVARRNAGNESLVLHGHTGLLYDSPDELISWVQTLLGSPDLCERIASTAKARIDERHAPALERRAYLELLADTAAHPAITTTPRVAQDELETSLAAGQELALSAEVRDEVAGALAWARETDERAADVRRLAALLATAPPSVALKELSAWRAAARPPWLVEGVDAPDPLFLLLALTQVPLARARLAARGVSAAVVAATLSDLAEWTHRLHAVSGRCGLTLELLEWSQRYLRGELVRLGPMQFDLRPFAAPFRVFRHVRTGELSALTLDGHRLDLSLGVVTQEPVAAHKLGDWMLMLEPGMPVLEMWMQGSFSVVSLREISAAMREAFVVFAQLAPETVPTATCGETWRLDPQLGDLVPASTGVKDMQRVCHLYPSTISEAKTLRRLFGPTADRRTLAGVSTGKLTPVQQIVAKFLSDPARHLSARGGFVLRDELESIPEWQ